MRAHHVLVVKAQFLFWPFSLFFFRKKESSVQQFVIMKNKIAFSKLVSHFYDVV